MANLSLIASPLVRVGGLLALILSLTGPAAAAQPNDMIEIPAGSFTMGRNDGPQDERPEHVVRLANFLIDRHMVTHADFALFLQSHGLSGGTEPAHYRVYDHDDSDARIHLKEGEWRADPGLEHHPVNEVTWAGARDYCAWKGKRLPTEAEWEKAARGTDHRRYPWGNSLPDASRARFASGWTDTVSVGTYPLGASPYGVMDMAGNNWEWVSSLYRPYPFKADDGRENLQIAGVRGTRGGGHDSSASDLTTTQRGKTLSRGPQAGHHNIGFRCAKD